MKIQYASDLHIEFPQNSRYLEQNPLQPSADILVLAGDVVPIHPEFVNDPFFVFISKKYKQVFWVPGNHEFYHNDISHYSNSYDITLGSNIRIVHNIEVWIDEVQLIFTSLWSHISKDNRKTIEQGVADFQTISNGSRKLNAEDFNKLHKESILFLKQALAKPATKRVVVTHHLPSPICNLKEHARSPINEAFCVDLSELVEQSGVNFWIHGHSHYNHSPIIKGKTILLTNQLGYVQQGEMKGFKHNAFISI